MVKRVLILAVGIALILVPFALAQPKPPSSEEMEKMMREEQKRMEELEREERERMVEFERRELERLKETNPELYKERMRAMEVSREISETMASYVEKEVDLDMAKRRLRPLIEESLKGRIEGLDREIETLTKRLEYLKKVKRDPSIMVEREIERMLGVSKPGELEEEMPY